MREGKIEKPNIEKSAIERLKEIKAKEENIKKEDPTYGTPWSIIDPEKLILEAQEIFDLFEKGESREELLLARERLRTFKDEIERMKNTDTKISNESFLKWIDDKIEGKILSSELKEDQEKDYRR